MNYQEERNVINSYESLQEFSKWKYEVPTLQFKSDWEVKILPAFGGAIIRFLVRKGNASVSVYLDAHNRLGYGSTKDLHSGDSTPYWEMYPYVSSEYPDDYEERRFYMNETDKLLNDIEYSLNQQLKIK